MKTFFKKSEFLSGLEVYVEGFNLLITACDVFVFVFKLETRLQMITQSLIDEDLH